MFPWQGDGKSGISMTPEVTAKSQQQQQQQQQQKDAGGYARWRLPTVLQKNQSNKANHNSNPNISSSTKSSIGNNNVSATAAVSATNPATITALDAKANVPGQEQVATSESVADSVDNDDDDDDGDENDENGEEDEEDEEEDNEDQEESEGEDIDFRVRDGASKTTSTAGSTSITPTAAAANQTTTSGSEQQQQQHSASNSPALRNNNSSNYHNNRRLNTEEEIKLFEICNKYSATFGERSKLCEWWKTVAEEFVRNYGGPYSWHSVRRKVDIVTRQRIKYLSEMKEGKIANDQATDEWRKVLEEWIPTWEKFENAEKRRIEVRDAKAASRKRKEAPISSPASGSNGSTPKRPAVGSNASSVPWQANPQKWASYTPPGPVYGGTFPAPSSAPHQAGHMAPPPPPPPPQLPPQFPTPSAETKMPEGYETMFRGPHAAHPLYPHPHMIPYPNMPYPPPPSPISATSAQQTPVQSQNERSSQIPTNNTALEGQQLTSVVIETLNKLNKHLDKADMSSSRIIAALAGGTSSNNKENNTNKDSSENDIDANDTSGGTSDTLSSSTSNNKNTSMPLSPTTTTTRLAGELTQLKNDLRQEIRAEFEAELTKIRAAFTAKLDSLEQTQEMIMDMLRQEPGREQSSEKQ